ncbi:MAG: right-handed parallel beta-helix repeat-containing protein [Myxococcota bacterium]
MRSTGVLTVAFLLVSCQESSVSVGDSFVDEPMFNQKTTLSEVLASTDGSIAQACEYLEARCDLDEDAACFLYQNVCASLSCDFVAGLCRSQGTDSICDAADAWCDYQPPAEQPISVVSAVASSAQAPNVAPNVLDGDLDTRWSANGVGEYVDLAFDGRYSVQRVEIAFFRGDQRSSSFVISVGEPNLEQVLAVEGSERTLGLVGYEIAGAPIGTRLRLTGNGNSDNTWNSITEIRVFGTREADPEVQVGVDSIVASGGQSDNAGLNVNDRDLSTRWSAEGSGQTLDINFDGSYRVTRMEVAFYQGDTRTAFFDIELFDGNALQGALSVTSEAQQARTVSLQEYVLPDLGPTTGLRFAGFGNTSNGWNSVTELHVYGIRVGDTVARIPPPADPTPDPPPPPTVTECNDGIDNDGDGLVDWQRDLGCWSEQDTSERALPRVSENGFTTFDPGNSSRVYYVRADGNDNRDGLSPANALRTLTRAAALVREGSHDFILLRRGDTFRNQQLGRFKSGRSESEPIVIASYGDSRQRPRLEVGDPLIHHNGQVRSNVALLGLHIVPFKSVPGDPGFTGAGSNGVRYVGGGSGHLIEDCHFQYGEIVVQSFGGGNYRNVDVRRNVIERAYHANTCKAGDPNGNRDYRPSGIFGSGITNLLLEENFFDHNGWNRDQVPSACATIWNHNAYLPKIKDSVIRGNLFSRASSIHIKVTASAVADLNNVIIEDNFMVGGEIGMSIGGNTAGPRRFRDVQVRDNVLSQIGRGKPTTRGLARGIGLQDNDSTVVERNILVGFSESNAWGIRISDTTNQDLTVQDNLLYAVRGFGFDITNSSGHTGVAIRGNRVFDPTHGSCLMSLRGGRAGYAFANNEFYTNGGANSFCTPTRVGFSAWTEASGAQGSRVLGAIPSFPAPNRTIDDYAVVVGAGDTLEEFIEARRQTSRLNWRPELTAKEVNAYFRGGFGMTP